VPHQWRCAPLSTLKRVSTFYNIQTCFRSNSWRSDLSLCLPYLCVRRPDRHKLSLFFLTGLGGLLDILRYLFVRNMTILSASLAESASTAMIDRSKTVKIATWTLLGVTVAFVVMRQFMKASVLRKAALDDVFILLATVSITNLPGEATANALRLLQLACSSQFSYWPPRVSVHTQS
jgi:hypothetical protein